MSERSNKVDKIPFKESGRRGGSKSTPLKAQKSAENLIKARAYRKVMEKVREINREILTLLNELLTTDRTDTVMIEGLYEKIGSLCVKRDALLVKDHQKNVT